MMERTDHDLTAYAYDVPAELIAQQPLPGRDESRLLVHDRASGTTQHRRFPDIIEYLRPQDCLVVNRTRVLPARIFASKETGGKVEVLFLGTLGEGEGKISALLRPFLPEGRRILFPEGISARIVGRLDDGEAVLEISGGDFQGLLERYGHMPLPPYIKRPKDDLAASDPRDRERYQTVFARETGSVAAPTAGLHFTEGLLARIREKGVSIAEITLHVGWGTFRPIVSGDITCHRMLPERYVISADAAEKINACRANGGKVIAVGTTTTRALESAAGSFPLVPATGRTSIFIYPGYRFKAVDSLITNFHMPHSTPLMMVSAFAGREKILRLYEEAIRLRYRFFSYGDAMALL
jgi:S-adenosylmethionine:tRNA ribosyltransferase-isomerase